MYIPLFNDAAGLLLNLKGAGDALRFLFFSESNMLITTYCFILSCIQFTVTDRLFI